MDLSVILPRDTYALIGRVANAWAKIEFSADLMNGVIFVRHGARAKEKRIPLALEQKLRFLRRWIQRIPALDTYRAETVVFVKDALEMKHARHAMIHGVARSHGPEGTTFLHLTNLTDNLGMHDATYSDDAILSLALASEELATRAFAVCHRFIDDWLEECDKTEGELARSKHRVFFPRLDLLLEKIADRFSRLFR